MFYKWFKKIKSYTCGVLSAIANSSIAQQLDFVKQILPR